MTGREPCRAARRGRGAGATFAQQSGDSGAPDTRQDQGTDCLGRVWSELSPLYPRKNGLSPRSMGTDFSNGDKGLRGFLRFVPTVPTNLQRHPEADQAKARTQTPRRAASLALAGMVRAVIRGAGVPPASGPSGCFARAGNSHPEPAPDGGFFSRLTFQSIRAFTVHFSR